MRLRPRLVVPIEWALTGIALVFLCLRLYVRAIRLGILDISDGVIIFAWLLSLAGVVCDTTAIKYGVWTRRVRFGPNYAANLHRLKVDPETALKFIYASKFPYYAELWAVKLAMVLLYYQIIPKSYRKTRIALHFTAAIVLISFVIVICLTLMWCDPISKNWSPDAYKGRQNSFRSPPYRPPNPNSSRSSPRREINEGCFAYSALVPYYVIVGLNLLTNLLLYLLSFPLVSRIIPTRSRIASVCGVYFLACLAITSTVILIIASYKKVNIPTLGLISHTEQITCLIVACCPALYNLLFPPVATQLADGPPPSSSARNNSHGSVSLHWWVSQGSTPTQQQFHPHRRRNAQDLEALPHNTTTTNNNNSNSNNLTVEGISRATSTRSNRSRRAVDGWIKSMRPQSFDRSSDQSNTRIYNEDLQQPRASGALDPIEQYKRDYGGRIISDFASPDERRSSEVVR